MSRFDVGFLKRTKSIFQKMTQDQFFYITVSGGQFIKYKNVEIEIDILSLKF